MARVSEKGVKELPTDSPYKPCFNKPLPATSFHWLNRGRPGIYSSVPAIWWWLPCLSAPPPPPPPSPSRSFHASSSGGGGSSSHSHSQPAAFMALAFFVFTYTSRYDFWGIVKQLQANSCSSLIPARHWKRGWWGVEGWLGLLHTWLGIFIQIRCKEDLVFTR